MRSRGLTLLATAAVVLSACESSTDAEVTYAASLSGQNEVPAVQSSGSGSFNATLSSNSVLTYTMTFTGLSSISTLAHIHGPASTTQTAAAIVDLDAAAAGRNITLGGTSGSANGTIDLSGVISASLTGEELRTMLDAGQLYVNVHTATNGGGEIRGQVIRQ